MQNNRRSLLAKIHIAKKQLGLTEDLYRDLLWERYGKSSAADLKVSELIDFCRHFEKLGFKQEPPKKKKRPRVPEEKASLIKKIVAQSYALGVPVPEYANGIARKMFGIEDFSWCTPDQLHKIVAALSYQQRRSKNVS